MLADEATNAKNCGWKDVMEVVVKGNPAGWVKRENVQAWEDQVDVH
jgi:hypothetical protein